MADVLERETALSDNTTPTGRKLGIILEKHFGLYKIGYVDGKAGDLPGDLSGRYTKGELAKADLDRYLKYMWDMNDAAVKKAERKAYKEKHVGTESESQSGDVQ